MTAPAAHITIPRKLYDELLADQKQLDGLHARGVDNWDGYASDDADEEDEE